MRDIWYRVAIAEKKIEKQWKKNTTKWHKNEARLCLLLYSASILQATAREKNQPNAKWWTHKKKPNVDCRWYRALLTQLFCRFVVWSTPSEMCVCEWKPHAMEKKYINDYKCWIRWMFCCCRFFISLFLSPPIVEWTVLYLCDSENTHSHAYKYISTPIVRIIYSQFENEITKKKKMFCVVLVWPQPNGHKKRNIIYRVLYDFITSEHTV